MMSRRRFLQLTVSIAAAAALPTLSDRARAGEPCPSAEELAAFWVPTVPEVAEWLEYYKLTVGAAHRRFADILLGLPEEGDPRHFDFEKTFAECERDFNAMEGARREVGMMQYSGYEAGRRGRARSSPRFRVASHPGFGWYHYWAVGDYDRRRELGLPRWGRTLEEEYAILTHQEPQSPIVLPRVLA